MDKKTVNKPSKLYDIGSVTFNVRPLDNGEQEITATNLSGKFDEQGYYHIKSGDVEPAVSLLFKIIPSVFKADIYVDTKDNETTFQIRRRTRGSMHISNHLPDKKAPFEMADRIVEVKKYPGGKRSLDDDVFAGLMEKLAKRFKTSEAAHKAYQQIAIHEERSKRAQRIAKKDQDDGHAERMRYKESFDQVRHQLHPIVLTLAQHGISTDEHLSDGVIIALLDTHSKADKHLREDPSALAREYVNALSIEIGKQGINVEDKALLESELLTNLCDAEIEFRNKGHGKTG